MGMEAITSKAPTQMSLIKAKPQTAVGPAEPIAPQSYDHLQASKGKGRAPASLTVRETINGVAGASVLSVIGAVTGSAVARSLAVRGALAGPGGVAMTVATVALTAGGAYAGWKLTTPSGSGHRPRVPFDLTDSMLGIAGGYVAGVGLGVAADVAFGVSKAFKGNLLTATVIGGFVAGGLIANHLAHKR
jgi:hypothetical protein